MAQRNITHVDQLRDGMRYVLLYPEFAEGLLKQGLDNVEQTFHGGQRFHVGAEQSPGV